MIIILGQRKYDMGDKCESTPTNSLICTKEPVTIAPHRNVEQRITAVDKHFQLVNKILGAVFPDDWLSFVLCQQRITVGTHQEVEFPEDTRNPFGNVPGLKEKTTMVVTCCWPIPNSRPCFWMRAGRRCYGLVPEDTIQLRRYSGGLASSGQGHRLHGEQRDLCLVASIISQRYFGLEGSRSLRN